MEMVADAVMVVGAKAVKRRAVAQHRGARTPRVRHQTSFSPVFDPSTLTKSST